MTQSILVVDDEPMSRNLLRLMLVRANFNVFEAEDGLDALNKLAGRRPDLLILDVMMPGLDGLAVCREVRSNVDMFGLPIIMLSAKTDYASIQQGFAAGASQYLTKPISADELTTHVRAMLEKVPA